MREAQRDPLEAELDFSEAELSEMNAEVVGREGERAPRRRRSMLRVPVDQVARPAEAQPRSTPVTEPSLPAIKPAEADRVDELVDHAFLNGGTADAVVPAVTQFIGFEEDLGAIEELAAEEDHDDGVEAEVPDEPAAAAPPADAAAPAAAEEPEEAIASDEDLVEDPDTDPRALAAAAAPMVAVDDEPTRPVETRPDGQAPADPRIPALAALARAVAPAEESPPNGTAEPAAAERPAEAVSPEVRALVAAVAPLTTAPRGDETPMELDGSELVEDAALHAEEARPPERARSLTPPVPVTAERQRAQTAPVPPPEPERQRSASVPPPAPPPDAKPADAPPPAAAQGPAVPSVAPPGTAPARPPQPAPPTPPPPAPPPEARRERGPTPPPAAAPAPPAGAEPSLRARRRRRIKQWFEEIFDDDYLRTLPHLTERQTQREAAFIADALEVPQGGSLLDLACGTGRHAMELAKRDYKLTGLDLSLPLLIRAADGARRNSLTINFIHGDMREMTFDSEFDGAYCMSTSFGYFDDDTNRKVAANLARALKPGGKLLIDVVNRDYLVRDLPTRVWWQGEGCVVLEEVDFNYFSSRLQVQRSIIFEDGRQVEQEISIRAYSLHEIGKVLHHSGFRVIEVSGGLSMPGRFFGAESREILVVAEKKANP